jgi:ABC-type transport system substrate-binding protein
MARQSALCRVLAPSTYIALNSPPIMSKPQLSNIPGIIYLNTQAANRLTPDYLCSPGNWEAFRDPKFRLALAYLWGDAKWVKELYGPAAEAEAGGLEGVWTVLRQPNEADLSMANKILNDAGYEKGADGWRTSPSGKKIDIQFMFPTEQPLSQLFVLAYKSRAEKLAIDITPVASDFASIINTNVARKFDMQLMGGMWMCPSPDYPMQYHVGKDDRPGAAVVQYGGAGDMKEMGGTGQQSGRALDIQDRRRSRGEHLESSGNTGLCSIHYDVSRRSLKYTSAGYR